MILDALYLKHSEKNEDQMKINPLTSKVDRRRDTKGHQGHH